MRRRDRQECKMEKGAERKVRRSEGERRLGGVKEEERIEEKRNEMRGSGRGVERNMRGEEERRRGGGNGGGGGGEKQLAKKKGLKRNKRE